MMEGRASVDSKRTAGRNMDAQNASLFPHIENAVRRPRLPRSALPCPT